VPITELEGTSKTRGGEGRDDLGGKKGETTEGANNFWECARQQPSKKSQTPGRYLQIIGYGAKNPGDNYLI